MAPFDARASDCGLVVALGDTRKTTFAAALVPSTIAFINISRLERSPKNSSTLPRP